MEPRFQDIRFNVSPYQRPGQTWSCGRTLEGEMPCFVGPDSKGRCLPFACEPLERTEADGSTSWRCTRPEEFGGQCNTCQPRSENTGEVDRKGREILRYYCDRSQELGGPCTQEPLKNLLCQQAGPKPGALPGSSCLQPKPPCKPRRSLQSLRSRTSLALFGIAFLFIAFMAGSSWKWSFFFPGPLSQQHAHLANSCQSCHPAADGGPQTWLKTAIQGTGAGQSQRCLECHQMGQSPFQAHSHPVEDLRAITRTHSRTKNLVGTELDPALQAPKELPEQACATCHKEHRGAVDLLVPLENIPCQNCHLQAFSSFGDGHPEFDPVAIKRPSLLFDHEGHVQHFKEEKEGPFECRACHQPDKSRDSMGLSGFEAMCATSCHHHAEQIQRFPLEILELPGLKLQDLADEIEDSSQKLQDPNGSSLETTLTKPTLPVGTWPKQSARFTSRLKIGTIDLLLLEWLADYRPPSRLPSSGRTLAKPKYKESVENLVWAYKKVVYGLLTAQRAGLAATVQNSTGESSELLIPHGLKASARQLANNAFPSLEAELTALQAGNPSDLNLYKARAKELEDTATGFTTGSRKSPHGITYIPQKHEDSLMKSWIEVTGGAAGQSDSAKQVFSMLTRDFETRNSSLAQREQSPGQCSKCHAVEQRSDGSKFLIWKAKLPSFFHADFTRFSHAPHLNQACQDCHQFSQEAQEGSSGKEASDGGSDFGPLQRTQCKNCHEDQDSGGSCLTCHQYHSERMTLQPVARPGG